MNLTKKKRFFFAKYLHIEFFDVVHMSITFSAAEQKLVLIAEDKFALMSLSGHSLQEP